MKGRWLRFLAAGALNTGLSYGAYLILHRVLPYQVAYAISYALGVVFAYWLNSRAVFGVPLSWRRFFVYPLIYVAQYALGALLLALMVEAAGVSKTWAPLVVVVLLIPLSYLANKWVLTRTRAGVSA